MYAPLSALKRVAQSWALAGLPLTQPRSVAIFPLSESAEGSSCRRWHFSVFSATKPDLPRGGRGMGLGNSHSAPEVDRCDLGVGTYAHATTRGACVRSVRLARSRRGLVGAVAPLQDHRVYEAHRDEGDAGTRRSGVVGGHRTCAATTSCPLHAHHSERSSHFTSGDDAGGKPVDR